MHPTGTSTPRRWAGSRSGSVSIVFALSAVPMVLLVGATVDYSRMVTKRSSLQQATDATVLAVARDVARNLPAAALAVDAANYFAGAAADDRAWIHAGPTVSVDEGEVCLSTRTVVPTLILSAASGAGLAPTPDGTVGARSCARLGGTEYEIALALDSSGSMNQSAGGASKLSSLQTAARQLVAAVNPAGRSPRAAIAVVPFTSVVNVGPGFANAAFMDTGGASSIHWQNFRLPAPSTGVWAPASKFDLFAQMGVAWQGCVEERPAPYTTTDTPAGAANPDTLFVPYLWPDEEATGQSAGKTALNGYFAGTGGACAPTYAQADAPGSTTPVTNVVANTLRGDTQTMVCKYRQAPVSAASAFSDANGNRLTAGPNLLCPSRPLTTLTTDTSTLNGVLDALVADGDTNLASGFMWAWRSISPNGPFGGQAAAGSGGRAPRPYGTPNSVKVIILMTDGYNHWANMPGAINTSAYSSFGYFANGRLGVTTGTNNRDLMDATTLSACANAKAAGVQVFTVGFSVPSDPIDATGLALLRSCASEPSMAYTAQDGSALVASFGEIASRLGGLRLVN